MVTLGAWAMSNFGGRVHARGQNLRRWFKARYAETFAAWDLLLTPTAAMPAMPLPGPEASMAERLENAGCRLGDTSPYD